MIGQNGVTDAVLSEIDRALHDHDLIKIRLRGFSREQRADELQRICTDLDAMLVASVGATASLFREDPDTVAAIDGGHA